MAGDPTTRRDARAANADGHRAAAESGFLLLRRKITIPEPATDSLHRPRLVERVMPTRRRVTALKAPAGFGKTALLADCCRRLVEDGVPVAWVSLDEGDVPAVLDTCIAFACRSAGLGVVHRAAGDSEPGDSGDLPRSGVGRTLREVEAFGRPFVLALDEPDRMKDPASVALLEFLLCHGPPNLHLAMTCREIPVGLDLGSALLEGSATMVGVDELRFSRSEIAQLLRFQPSHPELDSILAETAGWPFAVRTYRMKRQSAAPEGTRMVRDLAWSWLGSRLFERIEADERDLVLDIGLFAWMDAKLLDDVLERTDSMQRIDAIPGLAGLLVPVPGDAADRLRLHPLIRDYCIRRRMRETPRRFSAVHRRIAVALARRGETVAAVRHALDAGEGVLAGDFLEHAGGVRMPMRQGIGPFLAADRFLSEDIVSERPRLALSRCLACVLSGHFPEARTRYAAVAATLPGPGRHNGDEGDFDLSVDDCIVRADIALYSAERIGSVQAQAMFHEISRLAGTSRLDPSTRGNLWYRLGVAYGLTAQFEPALAHAALARQHLAGNRSADARIDLEMGQIAMAQGRVAQAEEHYRHAQWSVRASESADPALVLIARVLFRELALECNRVSFDTTTSRVPRVLVRAPASFSAYAAAGATAIDLKLRKEGVDSALAAAEGMLEYVLAAELPALVRYVSALRVSLLATAGRIGDAEWAWQAGQLPEDPRGCPDLTGQSWREMEALSCAHLRLLIARERFEEGRSFARDLCTTATARGLRRTLMRALSLSVALEHRAGGRGAAAGPLEEFLRLFGETPYAWPLVREHELYAPIVETYLDTATDSAHTETARSLLAEMRAGAEPRYPALSKREWQVLVHLEGRQDKQIAAALGLSAHGVRYHMRQLFTKLGVHSRAEALRRARELGLILGDF